MKSFVTKLIRDQATLLLAEFDQVIQHSVLINDKLFASELKESRGIMKMFADGQFGYNPSDAYASIQVDFTASRDLKTLEITIKTVTLNVNVDKVFDIYKNGQSLSTLLKKQGYLYAYKPGNEGIRQLLLHESRHGTKYNFYKNNGSFSATKRILEKNSERFYKKFDNITKKRNKKQ